MLIIKLIVCVCVCFGSLCGNDSFADTQADSIETNVKTYTYDDILEEMNQMTEEFLEEVIKMRNLVSDTSIMDINNFDDSVEPARRRRRRSIENPYMPDFIRDGIKLISDMMMLEKRICANKGFVIDFARVKFNNDYYVICLVKSTKTSSRVYYGPMDYIENSFEVNLSNPERIFALVSQQSDNEQLVVIIINNNPINEVAVMWFQIDRSNQIYQNNLKDLVRVSTRNAAVWERKNILILYDMYEEVLKLYRFVGTYFDLDQFIPISRDLNALCAFTFNGVPYLVLGYHSHSDQRQKDITVMRHDEYDVHQLHKIQNIQSDQGIIDIKYIALGYGTSQENFLVIVEKNYIIFYKFLKSKREFIVFQRIESKGVRKIFTYGDTQKLFVMGVIIQSNDVYFITYNSLRFIYSNINLRIFALSHQPVYFDRWFSEDNSRVQMLIGGHDGIRIYNVTFYHDNNLFKLWTEHLEWCQNKRTELSELERRTTIVNERFSEAYFTSDPLVIKGTLSVPAYQGVVEAKDYRQLAGQNANLYLNAEYFYELLNMQKVLTQVEQDIYYGHQQLKDALMINSNEIQTIYGNYTMKNVRIVEYRGNVFDNTPHVPFTETLNLITDFLNNQSIRYLFMETVSIQNNQIKVLNAMNFETIDFIQYNQPLQVNGLVNKEFNMSDIVTYNSNHFIPGKKRFHNCLIVEEMIHSKRVNTKLFDKETVLLTSGQQVIRNPIWLYGKSIRTNILNTNSANGINVGRLFTDAIQKNQPIPITMPVMFANGLEVYDLFLDGNRRINGENIQTLVDDVLWINGKNQTISGDYYFESDVSVMGNLYVNSINNKNIPGDLVEGTQSNLIEGKKFFQDLVYIQKLNITQNLNDLLVINGIPDIVLKHIPQNITGRKTVQSLYIQNNSSITGLLNDMSIEELYKQSKQRPTIQHFDRLYIENNANFEGGLWFDHLNTISQRQFDYLMHQSITLTEQWNSLEFNHVQFDDLRVNILDCDFINDLRLENDLLTINTNQTVESNYIFDNIILQNDSYILSINNYTMSNLNSIFKIRGDQTLTGTKIFYGDVYVNSVRVNFINDIPVSDLVFLDEIGPRKNITGVKYFQNSNLSIDNLIVNHLNVISINNVNVANILNRSLLRNAYQIVPNHIRFQTLWSERGENFQNQYINNVNIRHLYNDVVFANNEYKFQNVTASKTFFGDVYFRQLEFSRLFDGVTLWEIDNNWLVQNVTQNIFANFSIDHLAAESVYIHNSKVNNIDLNWLHENAIWLDQKKSIWTNLQFMGNTRIHGTLQSSFNINQMNIQNDLIYSNPTNIIQTFRGKIKLLGNLTVINRLDMYGFINGIQINKMCNQIYRPSLKKSIVINGNVQIISPLMFVEINGIPYNELHTQSLRHNLPQQKVYGKKIIETLYLYGPTQLNKYINDVNLEYIFQNYMSLTRNQNVEANIILQNDQIMAGDVYIKDNFYVENGVVGGLDIAKFHKHALRIYGDQQYEGNINFIADVDIDVGLDLKWINGINTNYFMHKKRKTNVFTEEVIFTQTLHVKDGAHVVSGKRVSGVDMNSLTNYAILKNSKRNYTVYGSKTFDAVVVYYIHTKPLNNVPFSRENLMLKNHDQVVRGEKYFNGDVVINSSIVVNTINQVPINDLNNRIVKRTQNNIVKAKVRIRDLNVNTVKVNALIDNIDISFLDTLSDRVSLMKNLEREVRNSKNQFDIFEKNLNTITHKLLFYEHFLTASSVDFNLNILHKPLFVCTIHQTFYIFLPVKIFYLDGCNEINVYSMHPNYNNSIFWHHQFTLYIAGKVLSIHQNENRFLVSSNFNNFQPETFRECVLKNKFQDTVKASRSGVLIQIFQFFAQTSFSQTGLEVIDQEVLKPSVNWIVDTPATVSVAFANSFSIVQMNSIDIDKALYFQRRNVLTTKLEGNVKKVVNDKTSMFILSQLEGLNTFQLDIFLTQDNYTKVQSIPLFEANDMLIVDNSYDPSNHYRKFILVSASQGSLVNVYGTINENRYFKVQEIEQSIVKKMHVIYAKLNVMDPFVLMQTDHSIIIYRFAGMQGFQYYSRVEFTNKLQTMYISNIYDRHVLLLYYADCDENDEQSKQIEFLSPIYRHKTTYGDQVSLHGSSESILNRNESYEYYR